MWCCSPATHMCRAGLNQYCTPCHNIVSGARACFCVTLCYLASLPSIFKLTSIRPLPHPQADLNARTTGTVMNWLPVLARDPWRYCAHTRAGAPPCPLGKAPHPAHGVKFALGCQPCKAELLSLEWEK